MSIAARCSLCWDRHATRYPALELDSFDGQRIVRADQTDSRWSVPIDVTRIRVCRVMLVVHKVPKRAGRQVQQLVFGDIWWSHCQRKLDQTELLQHDIR